MEQDVHHRPSQLFTVRLWMEEMGTGEVEWRGKVQHATSGEAHYFRDWPTLVTLLVEMAQSDWSAYHQSKTT